MMHQVGKRCGALFFQLHDGVLGILLAADLVGAAADAVRRLICDSNGKARLPFRGTSGDSQL
jgi:hypothetical protein